MRAARQKPEPRLTRRTPNLAGLFERKRRRALHPQRERLTGFVTEAHTSADVFGACDSRGVEDFSAGGLECLKAANGVVEVGAAVKVIFGAGDEHEGKR